MNCRVVGAIALCLAQNVTSGGQAQANRPPPATAQSPRAQVELAKGLVAQRRFPEAEAQLKAFLQRVPRDLEACNLLGVVQFSQKDYHGAAATFGRAVELGTPTAELLNNWGVSLFQSDQLPQARAVLSRALQLDPTNSRAHMMLARVAVLENDIEAAEREFLKSIESGNLDPGALLHYGTFLFQERRLEEARTTLERALAADPTLAVAHNYLGLTLQRLGEAGAAKAHLQRFREMTEIEVGGERVLMRVSAALRAAQREIADGNLEAALGAALDAVTEGPQFAVVHQTLADVYRRMGRMPESEAALQRAQQVMEAAARQQQQQQQSGAGGKQ